MCVCEVAGELQQVACLATRGANNVTAGVSVIGSTHPMYPTYQLLPSPSSSFFLILWPLMINISSVLYIYIYKFLN